MFFRFLYILLVWASVCLLTACGAGRRLQEGEKLLWKNTVDAGNAQVSSSALEDLVRQKPNRKIIFLRFYLQIYNLKDPEKVQAGIARKRSRIDAENEERLMNGQDPRQYKPTFWEWMRNVVGEPPVLLDSSLCEVSAEQINLYMQKHGYFNARTTYEVTLKPRIRAESRRKKAVVEYLVTPGTPYTLRNITQTIPDTAIARHLLDYQSQSKLKSGDLFSTDKLDAERGIYTSLLRDNGYYIMSKEFFTYKVDSALGTHQVDVELHLTPYVESKGTAAGDSARASLPYPKHVIRSIRVGYRSRLNEDNSALPTDSASLGDYTFIQRGPVYIKPQTLARNIMFGTNEYYDNERVSLTYRRLTQLSIINSASVQFAESSDSTSTERFLDCAILLSPARIRNITFEVNGTNNIGNLGVNGSLGFTNRNLFRGAERFTVSLQGGIEAQQLLINGGNEEASASPLAFNTVEFGPEFTLEFPRFLIPFLKERTAKSANPRTQLSAGFSFQRRPDYTRNRFRFSLPYSWNETDFKRWTIVPLEVSFVEIDKSQAFQDRLNEINDPYLINSYNDQFIPVGRITYNFNNQALTNRPRVFYYLSELETSGLLMRSIYNAFNAPENDNDQYTLFGVPFSHYAKVIQEVRVHRNYNEKTQLAYRFYGGIGIPLNNLTALPFEKSFFGGGANGIRAWQARTLGPGSFRNPYTSFDRIGDIHLEANVEYRFDLIDFFEGAFFVDAGNVWLLREQLNDQGEVARPGGTFKPSEFLSEVAVGAGFGLRLNFDYFLIRLDAAVQVKDPTLDPGERWLFEPKDDYNTFIRGLNETNNTSLAPYSTRINFNLGIGYPF